MAHFVLAVDPDPERRRRFIVQAHAHLSADRPGQPLEIHSGSLACVGWRQPLEPWSWEATDTEFSLRVGDPRRAADGRAVTAMDLKTDWAAVPAVIPPVFDGIYGALVFRSRPLQLIAGADLMGLFPIYYTRCGDILLVSSSPGLFACHPLFRVRLNLLGLTGILLFNGLVDGETLFQEVRRLDAGNLLVWQEGKPIREVAQYRIPLSDRYFNEPHDQLVRIVGEGLDAAIGRCLAPRRSYGFSFSGGLDSRLLGGLVAQQGFQPLAVTFGNASDIEMRCAKSVVQALKWSHRSVAIDEAAYPEYARQELASRHLANGFNCLMLWQDIPGAETLKDGLLSGYGMDCIIGAANIALADESADTLSFDRCFKKFNRWGIEPEVLRGLLTMDGAEDAIEWVIERLRRRYESYPGEAFQKVWCFGLHHRTRFHTSAALGLHTPWPWPQVPYLSASIFELMGSLPYGSIKERRIEHSLLHVRFPELARLPLDRNHFNLRPLATRYHPRVDAILYSALQRAYQGLRDWGGIRGERRYYHRVINFNNRGWRLVRQQAEPFRDRLHSLMDGRQLEQLLPAPNATPQRADEIINFSQSRLLTGLILWARQYL